MIAGNLGRNGYPAGKASAPNRNGAITEIVGNGRERWRGLGGININRLDRFLARPNNEAILNAWRSLVEIKCCERLPCDTCQFRRVQTEYLGDALLVKVLWCTVVDDDRIPWRVWCRKQLVGRIPRPCANLNVGCAHQVDRGVQMNIA